jgi:hypothetical protein
LTHSVQFAATTGNEPRAIALSKLICAWPPRFRPEQLVTTTKLVLAMTLSISRELQRHFIVRPKNCINSVADGPALMRK